MFCSNCGAKLDDSALFCGECGTKVEAVVTAAVEEAKDVVEATVTDGEAAVEAAQEAVEAAVAQGATAVEEVNKAVEAAKETVEATVAVVKTEESASVTEPAKQEEVAAEAPAPEKKKGGKGGIIALIIILVLVLAGGGVAAWYFTSDGYNCKKYLKQAETAFAASELEDAKDYYETVLEYDETQKDIYVKLADIAVQDGKYESAIKTLKKGIKNTEGVEGAKDELTAKLEAAYMSAIDEKVKATSYKDALTMVDEAIAEVNTPALVQKKKDIYMDQVTDMMDQQSYWDALDIAHKGFEATADKDFQEKIADVYIAMAEQEAEYGNYSYALGLVEQALYEVDTQKLKDAKVTLYKRWIDSDIEDANYSMAVYRTRQAYDETSDEAFKDQEIDTYLAWAESLVSIGEYEEALDALEDGVYYTQSEELSAKIEEINNAEVLLSKEVIDRITGTSKVYEYNEKGLETKITYYDEYGSATKIKVCEYDEEGNVTEYREYDGTDELLGYVVCDWVVVEGKKQCIMTSYVCIEGVEYVFAQETVDEKNNTLSYTEYNADGSASVLKQYEYDEAGKLVKEEIVTDEESINNQYEYAYDDAGNVRGFVIRDADGEIVSAELFEYDENGNMIANEVNSEEYNYLAEYVYDGDELLQYTYTDIKTGDVAVTTYNTTKEGNVETVEEVDYYNNVEIDRTKLVSEYDEEGRLLHAELFDKDGMSIASDYIEYDEKGNETYALKGLSGEVEEYIINYEYGFPRK